MMTHDDRGEGGVKNCQNGGDVICGWPLSAKIGLISRRASLDPDLQNNANAALQNNANGGG